MNVPFPDFVYCLIQTRILHLFASTEIDVYRVIEQFDMQQKFLKKTIDQLLVYFFNYLEKTTKKFTAHDYYEFLVRNCLRLCKMVPFTLMNCQYTVPMVTAFLKRISSLKTTDYLGAFQCLSLLHFSYKSLLKRSCVLWNITHLFIKNIEQLKEIKH